MGRDGSVVMGFGEDGGGGEVWMVLKRVYFVWFYKREMLYMDIYNPFPCIPGLAGTFFLDIIALRSVLQNLCPSLPPPP